MPDFSISIIIPCKKIDSLTEKCLQECLELDHDDFEILVLPDDSGKEELEKFSDEKIKIINTGKVKPALKRNIGMEKASGNFFAFIDSDAYPEKDWLKNAMKYFGDEKIGIAGGPNLTPPEANLDEHISGHVLSNFWVSGPASIRYKRGKNQYCKELPSCNYISRKEISPKYKEGLLTAEDSKFCFDVKKQGYKILYANDVVVYHHRRDTIKKHIKQMFIYGRDIAWLTKEEFSFDMIYYSLLSLFVVGFFLATALSFFYPIIRIGFSILVLFYFLFMLVTNVRKNFIMSLYVMTIGVVTHFAYGIGFLWGIFVRNENEIHVK
jgi:cellulose synthase/poly-beta-1,6-N-acetylglucosamine synthase-like glycosyltransferase